MSLVHILLENFTPSDDIEDIRVMLEREGIDIVGELDYFINKGANGKVFKIKGKDKVLKVERYSRTVFEQNSDMMEISSDNIVNIYYLKELKDRDVFISVMEYLEPLDGNVNYTEEAFRLVVVRLEGALNEKYPKYRNINMVEKKRIVQSHLEDKDLFNEMEETFSIGDDSLIRSLAVILATNTHNINSMDQLINDLIDNEKFFFDIYYGIEDMIDNNFYHNDINIFNVLFDPKSNNFKIIDPWMDI